MRRSILWKTVLATAAFGPLAGAVHAQTPIAPPSAAQTQTQAQTKGHITGVGGVFVTSPDPKALAKWYRDVLGVELQPWGGALLPYDAPGHPPAVVWSAMRATSGEIAPSKREFMLNLAVDDLDAMVAKLKAKGVEVLKRQDDATGAFAWIMDPDGTKLELWQPKAR